MPEHGYTAIVEQILDHERIGVHLNSTFSRSEAERIRSRVLHRCHRWLFRIFSLGRLGYRTLDFKEIRAEGDYQGCAVMNYGDEEVPYTRISEHKYFSPWEEHEKTICFKEFSRACEEDDIPYYPIRLVEEKGMLKRYVELAKKERNISFLGRLGTYRYLDMDVTIAEALATADEFLKLSRKGSAIPDFFRYPGLI